MNSQTEENSQRRNKNPMPYFTNDAHIRIDKEIIEKIDEILKAFPDRFDSQSHVIRAAINYMHRKEVTEHERTTIHEMGY